LASNAEEWGLVVNESMACSTPVICSDGIGSAYDLIQDGNNGFIFKSDDVEALSLCLFRSLEVSSDLSFKNNIQETIKHWDLGLFCKSAYLSFLHASSQKR
jgi:glycosyltransferase involved in cell wall biosynthesis